MLSPDATVIALTAFPDDDNRHASLRLGATHFLEKPVDLATIADLAARYGVPTAMRPDVASTASGEVLPSARPNVRPNVRRMA